MPYHRDYTHMQRAKQKFQSHHRPSVEGQHKALTRHGLSWSKRDLRVRDINVQGKT